MLNSYLAHGVPVRENAWFFRVNTPLMYTAIPEVCQAISEELGATFLNNLGT